MTHQIWLGSEQAFYAHAAKYEAILKQYGTLAHAVHDARVKLRSDDDVDYEDEDHNGFYWVNPVSYEIVESVAVVSVTGETETLTSNFTRLCDIPTYDDIRYRLNQAYADNQQGKVKSVMLRLDTPGGLAKGAYGMSEYIEEYNKKIMPVVSFTDGVAASAAVLYGSAARAFVADQYADVGSIGSFAVFLDLSGMLKMNGVKATVFRSGQYKGKPNQYEGLDKDGEKVLSDMVMRHHDRFVAVLSKNIGISVETINKEIANGKMFSAQEALSLGLIQSTATFEKTLATMNRQYQNSNATAARPMTA